jgi:hypothetical protein
MNANFVKACGVVKRLATGEVKLFPLLLTFVLETCPGTDKGVALDIKKDFKKAERDADSEMKVKMGDNSTYRVAKGVLINSVAAGLALCHADGKPKGKTELENELADLKVPKSEIEKFKAAIGTAEKIGMKLPASDLLIAAALVNELLKEVSVGLKLAA